MWLPLLLRERRDELAAEGWDIWDDAAPDQAKMRVGSLEPISEGARQVTTNGSSALAGVPTGVRSEGPDKAKA